jgi:hypothetical protein
MVEINKYVLWHGHLQEPNMYPQDCDPMLKRITP